MGIIVKKKPRYNKKKLLQRIALLVLIYCVSFVCMYSAFGEKKLLLAQDEATSVYKNDGEKLLAEHDYSKAVEYYLKAIDDNVEDYKAMTNVSIAYKNLKQYDKAKFYVFKSKELAPNYVENFVQIADIYIKEGKYNIAESAIDAIPTTTKQNFLEKAKMLIVLADAEPELEEKIVHYERALIYFKKYDYDSYKLKINKLTELLFQQADLYVQKRDVDNVKVLYKKILTYNDTCEINNRLALKYQNISDDDLMKTIIQAVKQAESQDERRLTKKNLITLRYYFEKKHDGEKVKVINGLLALLDGNAIITDERYLPYSVQNDSLELIATGIGKYTPKLIFSIKNKSDKGTTKLYAKADVYVKHGKVLDSKVVRVVNIDSLLLPNEQSSAQTIILDAPFSPKKADRYTVTLSFSDDAKNWQLYKIYKPQGN